jgi:mannan endo-1,4-beta-mannosidase
VTPKRAALDRRRFLQVAGGLVLATGVAGCVRTGADKPQAYSTALNGPDSATPAVVDTTPDGPLPDPPAAPLPPADPADPNATADTRAVLTWLRSLRGRTTQKVLAGQQLTPDAKGSYQTYVEGLATLTGKYPALVGAGFNALWTDTTRQLLTTHWQAGGIVTMEFHATDPWNPAGGVNSAWVSDVNAPKNDLRQLLSTARSSSARTEWQGQVDALGDALTTMAQDGVVVILRPFFENNGSWFWWGQDMTTRNTALVALYQDLFQHLTQTRGLHNLLWVHSPCASWDGPMMQYYPGDDHVDLIAPTCYDDDLLFLGDRPGQRDHTDYADILAAGKPLGFGECGPNNTTDGSWDCRLIIDRIRNNYTGMVYFDCWSGWDSTVIQLVGQKNATQLMNDPGVITRDTVDWKS